MKKYITDKLKWSIALLVKDIDPETSIMDKEGCLLFDYASEVPFQGTIVEIGSWKGRSTIWLGQAAMLRDARVLAVDPHEGLEGKGESYNEFLQNIEKGLVKDRIIPILQTSEKFFNESTEEFDMVFLDGLHDFSTVINDTLEGLSHLKENGILAMHDTIAYKGPYKSLKLLLSGVSSIKALKQVGQVTVLRKTRPSILNSISNIFFYVYFELYSLVFLTAKLLPNSIKEKVKKV